MTDAKSRNSRAAAQVVLIEDDEGLAEEIKAELERQGHQVRHVANLAEGEDIARAGADILIMDRMLQGVDAISMLEALRADGVKAPVLVISALSSVDERINGLKAGGDDYLIKPFALGELTARVDALVRRLADVRTTRLKAGPIEMDLIEHTVTRDGTSIELLPREFKLLEYFLRRPGQLVTRSMLLEGVWRYRFVPETNVVDVHIGNLRRKIDVAGRPSLIVNIRGAGFMLNADA
jgi:two-component system OmpR family response regulator